MAKVLVTGASGFIGSHLVPLLCDQGHDVTCLVRDSSNITRLHDRHVRLIAGDVASLDDMRRAVEGIEQVYHLAGQSYVANQDEFRLVNTGGMRNMAQACAERTSPPTLMVVSSLAAAGPARPENAKRESDPGFPVSNYGRSKLAGEAELRAFADRVPITVVRPPIVFGPRDPAMLDMFKPIRYLGLHFKPGYGTNYFSLVCAIDLVQFFVQAMERGERMSAAEGQEGSGIYFAAADEVVSYTDLGREIGKGLGKRVLVIPLPMHWTWLLAAINELVGKMIRKPPHLGFDKVREAKAGSWVCNDEKARTQLGYRPGASLEERIRQTCESYRELGWL